MPQGRLLRQSVRSRRSQRIAALKRPISVRRVDRRTRQLHAWQEATVVFCLLAAVTLALFIYGIISRDRTALICGGLFTLSTGISLRVQLRRRPK